MRLFNYLKKFFAEDQQDKFRISDQVTLPHSSWLLHRTVKPFQAGLLHPKWRTFYKPRYYIKASAYAHNKRGLDDLFIFI